MPKLLYGAPTLAPKDSYPITGNPAWSPVVSSLGVPTLTKGPGNGPWAQNRFNTSTRLSRCARCDASHVRNLLCPCCPRLRRAGCPPGSAPGGARCISSACVLRWAGTAAVLWRCPRPDWLPTRWMTLTRRTRTFYFYLLHSGTPPLSLPDRGPWRDVVASSQLPHLGFVGACRLRRRRSLALHLDEASVL